MTEYIFYTHSMKYDTDMKTNKLELYQIHSFPWKKWEVVKIHYSWEGEAWGSMLIWEKQQESQNKQLI